MQNIVVFLKNGGGAFKKRQIIIETNLSLTQEDWTLQSKVPDKATNSIRLTPKTQRNHTKA